MKRGLKSAVDILIINLSAADCLYCFGLPIWANGTGHFSHDILKDPKLFLSGSSGEPGRQIERPIGYY